MPGRANKSSGSTDSPFSRLEARDGADLAESVSDGRFAGGRLFAAGEEDEGFGCEGSARSLRERIEIIVR